MAGYYVERLAGERLRRCYELATPPVRRHLAAELEFVRRRLRPGDVVLELGCGYGRALAALAGAAGRLWGIDSSRASLRLARRELAGPLAGGTCRLAAMDAGRLGFRDGTFDVVVCIQNGVSAFGLEPVRLAREALRVTRPRGAVLLSSYAERFWPARLDWFERQAAAGLLGEIDRERTGDGTIVCRDGFRATTFGPDDFRRLGAALGLVPRLAEAAGSSLFCELVRPGGRRARRRPAEGRPPPERRER